MILGVRIARLITIEGLDGAGKTTLVAGLTRELQSEVHGPRLCATRVAESKPVSVGARAW